MNDDFFKTLGKKLESKVDKEFDNSFWTKIAEHEKEQVYSEKETHQDTKPWWYLERNWSLGLALSACLLVFVVSKNLTLPNRALNQSTFAQMIEAREMLEDYELFAQANEQLESKYTEDLFELTDEEWEILLNDEPEAKS